MGWPIVLEARTHEMCLEIGKYGMGLGYYVMGPGSGELRQGWVRETII